MHRRHRTAAGSLLLAIPVTLALVLLDLGAAASSQPVGANPLLSLSRNESGRAALGGLVEERLDAGSYSYLALRTDAGARLWAVTLGDGAPAGARVALRSFGTRSDFYSRRLDRTFPELVFAMVRTID
jgi:hypothetical protein